MPVSKKRVKNNIVARMQRATVFHRGQYVRAREFVATYTDGNCVGVVDHRGAELFYVSRVAKRRWKAVSGMLSATGSSPANAINKFMLAGGRV